MGPRLRSRGTWNVPGSDPGRSISLQWGRGFEAAERITWLSAISTWEQLQWGRGFEAAERVRMHLPDFQGPTRALASGAAIAAARQRYPTAADPATL